MLMFPRAQNQVFISIVNKKRKLERHSHDKNCPSKVRIETVNLVKLYMSNQLAGLSEAELGRSVEG